MIPARIISIDDKVMVEYWANHTIGMYSLNAIKRFVSEVENARSMKPLNYAFLRWYGTNEDNMKYGARLSLNQQVFIEQIENNKVKIVKI